MARARSAPGALARLAHTTVGIRSLPRPSYCSSKRQNSGSAASSSACGPRGRSAGIGLLMSGFVEAFLQPLIGCLFIFGANPARGTNGAQTARANTETLIKDTVQVHTS